MSKNEILAYLAGLCDGEAYIGIKKTKANKHLTGRIAPGYHERIQVRMVDESAIKLLAETLGGWYYKEHQPHKKRRPLYCYQSNDLAAAKAAKILLPFLRIKREQAELILKLRANKIKPDKVAVAVECLSRWGKVMTVRRMRFSDNTLNTREVIWQSCKHLNRVGPR